MEDSYPYKERQKLKIMVLRTHTKQCQGKIINTKDLLGMDTIYLYGIRGTADDTPNLN